MTDKIQLEYVAVKTPTSDACRQADCDGHIEWLDGKGFPKCSRCSQQYCFGRGADADAKTIAMLEAMIKSFKRGAAKGGRKTKDIAEVVSHPTGHDLKVCGVVVAAEEGPTFLRAVADEVNAASGCEETTDGN